MSQQILSSDLVSIALDRVEGMPFERFVNDFYPAIAGVEYVPLGGMHDGGADGVIAQGLAEGRGLPGTFLQASVQEDHRAKIRNTIGRLREVGRAPKSLTYVTPRLIPHVDREEEKLSAELNVIIRIRDRRYLAAHINTSPVTIAAFEQHLRSCLSFLNTPGNVPIISVSETVQSPAVYVFLRQEVERRLGNTSLLDAVGDALILWSLEGTDPAKGVFMRRDEILAKIEATVPPARRFIRSILDHRLEALASKSHPGGREVRWHRKQGFFCLPFETRALVEEENLEDEAARIRMMEILTNRASTISRDTIDAETAELLARVAVRSFQLAFEREGIEFAAFLLMMMSSAKNTAWRTVSIGHFRKQGFPGMIWTPLKRSSSACCGMRSMKALRKSENT
jgi:hypothetical protein